MITDKISNWKLYSCLRNAAAAFEFIQKAGTDLADGEYKLDGDNVIVKVMSPKTRPEADAYPEFHKVYADIQVLLSGNEFIDCAPLEGLAIRTPYDSVKDVGFSEKSKVPSRIRLYPGVFVLLLPGDAHTPLLECSHGVENVKKIVVKIKADMLK